MQSCRIYFGTSLNDDYDVSGGFFIRVNSDGAFAAVNGSVGGIYRNLSIFVALISDPSSDGALNLLNLAVFVNNAYRNFVVFSDRALFGTEFEGLVGVRLNNSQSLGYELLVSSVVSNDFDFSTDQRVVYCRVNRSYKSTILDIDVTSCFAIEAIIYIWSINLDAVFININCINSYELTKGDLVVNSQIGFVRVARIFSIVVSVDVKNSILDLTKLRSIESYSCIIFARKSNTHFIFTFGQIGNITGAAVSFVSQGVHTICCIPNKFNLVERIIIVSAVVYKLRIVCFVSDFNLATFDVTSYRFTLLIGYRELNSVGEIYILGAIVYASSVGLISTSQYIAIGYSSINIYCRSFSRNKIDAIGNIFAGQIKSSITLIFNSKSQFKFTEVIGYIAYFVVIDFNNRVFVSGQSNGFSFYRIAIFVNSSTFKGYLINTIIVKIRVNVDQLKLIRVVFVKVQNVALTIGGRCSNLKLCNLNIFVANSYSSGTLKIVHSCFSQIITNTCMQCVDTIFSESNIDFSVIAYSTSFINIWFAFNCSQTNKFSKAAYNAIFFSPY